jgi:arylsulfatase A-like enzyme
MLDRVAADGAVFENHISSTSWTLPAHAAIFSSLPDSVHGCTDTDRVLAEGVTTLAERFAAAGYDTAGFFAGPYLHPAFGLAQGFEHYQNCTSYAPLLDEAPKESWAMDVDVMRRSHRDVTNPTVTAAFTRWLRRPLRARFFAFVHLWDVHYDFVPPPPFDTMFDPDYDGPVTGENFFFDETINPDMPARDLEHLVALYDGEIAWTDAHLGRIIAELAATGRLDDTVIAVTSDHGTAFFEHGHKGHRLSLFDELIRVPLVIRYPPVIDPGTRIRTQTRAIDVAPTLLELAALPVPEEFMGESLVPLTGAGEHAFDHVAISELFSVGRRQRTARTNEWKLYDVMDQDKRFWTDLLRDPAERQLQAAGPGGGPAELAARYDEIAAILDQHARRRDPAGGPGDLPDDVRRQLRALGYVGAE